ncbi:MAG: tryptophan--tRNA ligase [Patescibacteria group bacterium]|nr:tryptophan--tRNA ligase [Patescibacteria group bacterium]
MAKPVLVSGIQPTGKLHLGNYLGALKNFVELQNSGKYLCYFSIVDYHSLSEVFSPKEKSKQILELIADFLAAGLDPQKSTIFVQSAVPAHTELAWVLSTVTPFGELRRMTQFKEKSEDTPQNINVGLFNYPVLMSADIIIYNAKFVPVGDDQLQHLEFTRMITRKFNKKFGKTFTEPKPLLTNVPRLMSLDNPSKKMSKSRPGGCLFIDDTPTTIREKIKRAVTDSGSEVKYSPKNKPAISNLLLIYSAMSGKSVKTLEKSYKGKGYAEFKKDLAEVVVKALTPFQKKKKALKTQSLKLKATLTAGNKKANTVASKKLLEVKKKIGLIL